MEEREGKVRTMISVKFGSLELARTRIEVMIKTFPFDCFLCNISESEEQRDKYKREVQLLFKVKKAFFACTLIQSDQVGVDKQINKVYFVQGQDFESVAHIHSRTSIAWATIADMTVRERARMLPE